MTYTELQAAICDYTQNFDQDFVSNIPVFVQQAEQRIFNTVQFPSIRKNVTGVTSTNNKYLSCPDDFLAVYSLAVYPTTITTNTYTDGVSWTSSSLNAGLLIFFGASAALLAQISQIKYGDAVVVNGTGYVAAAPSGANAIVLTTPTTLFDPITTVALTTTEDGVYTYLLNKDVNFIREAYPNPTSTAIPKYYALFGPTTTNAAPPVITDELTFILGPTPNAVYNVELHYYYYPESLSVAADGRTWLGDNFDTVLLYGSLVEAITFMKGEADMVALYDGKYKEALGMAKRLGDGMERQDAYRSGQYRQAVT
jgi:hypothetical protein